MPTNPRKHPRSGRRSFKPEQQRAYIAGLLYSARRHELPKEGEVHFPVEKKKLIRACWKEAREFLKLDPEDVWGLDPRE